MPTIEPENEQLKSGPKIARIVDVDPATLRRWRREGCPSHIVGAGLVRYRLDEVLAWRARRPSISKEQRQAQKEPLKEKRQKRAKAEAAR